jgi:hypothetical protein
MSACLPVSDKKKSTARVVPETLQCLAHHALIGQRDHGIEAYGQEPSDLARVNGPHDLVR